MDDFDIEFDAAALQAIEEAESRHYARVSAKRAGHQHCPSRLPPARLVFPRISSHLTSLVSLISATETPASVWIHQGFAYGDSGLRAPPAPSSPPPTHGAYLGPESPVRVHGPIGHLSPSPRPDQDGAARMRAPHQLWPPTRPRSPPGPARPLAARG